MRRAPRSPAFPRMPLAEVRRSHVEQWIKQMVGRGFVRWHDPKTGELVELLAQHMASSVPGRLVAVDVRRHPGQAPRQNTIGTSGGRRGLAPGGRRRHDAARPQALLRRRPDPAGCVSTTREKTDPPTTAVSAGPRKIGDRCWPPEQSSRSRMGRKPKPAEVRAKFFTATARARR